ncbi:Arylsulfatase [Lunatimonas lonarensis]|uniref:Arylsulfatase n=1 Tax=Lunatimonas lonarensis TaxID=1232681 RepID=R7ZYX3_9BACT|nr:sulfatase [Lunatimonas lonarensis]EON79248.1 Arylsulfatase [Lunatimonas lonarensis]
MHNTERPIYIPSLVGPIILSWALILLVGCGTNDPAHSSPHQAPNIVFILADDLGWADVGFNGQTFYETPHIDRLAKEGIVFDRFYPSAANCAPSRAGILMGMYNPRHHVYLPQGYARPGDIEKMRWKVPTFGEDSTYQTFQVNINHVDSAWVSLAELLNTAGYQTGRFGKWHIGDDNQGFKESSSAGIRGEFSNKNGTEGRYYNDTTVAERLTDAALSFIDENQHSPFFIYLSHWEVHNPMAAKSERIRYYESKKAAWGAADANPTYASEVEQLDISVGRILDRLSELGLAENTLVIFTSDNGGLVQNTSNDPLKSGKGSFYEGGIRAPLCMRWPRFIKPNGAVTSAVSGIDFMPTFAELANVPLPTTQPVDGVSIVPLLRGDTIPERSIFFHFPLYLKGEGAERVLPIYGTQENHWRAVPSTTVIRGDWKLIYYYEYGDFELFDLKNDLAETTNVALSKKEIADELLKEVRKWTAEVDAPIPQLENDKFLKTATIKGALERF